MLFWQLVSVLREDQGLLQSALQDQRWQQYAEWLRDFDDHVDKQNRQVLDAELPRDLCLAALRGLQTEFGIKDGFLRRREPQVEYAEVLSAVAVFERFGGEAIEEVFEYGSCQIDS